MSPIAEEVEQKIPVKFETARDNDGARLLQELSKPFQEQPDERKSGWPVVRDVLIALAVALALRIPYYHWRLFPLSDGGMFAQIIDDMRNAHFSLPPYTTYNFSHIPLSYPPLAFYLGALCTLLPGQTAVSVLAWLPLLVNLICVVIAYLLVKEIYPSNFYACLATCCYASLGASSEWYIMGGGLTRGLGHLWALVAILFFLRSRKGNGTLFAALSGVCGGLAALSHLEAGIFAATSLIVLSLVLPERRRNMQLTILAGFTSALTVVPWLTWVYRHLGFGPLINASHAGFWERPIGGVRFAVGAAGIIFALVARFPYVLWYMAVVLMMPRSGTHSTPIIIGLCIVWFANASVIVLTRRSAWLQPARKTALVVLAISLSLYFRGWPSVRSDRLADLEQNRRAQVSPAEVEGMYAATRLTPPNAKFFVFSQRSNNWALEMVAEWFPYFAQRRCVNTVQATEWLPNNTFYHLIELQDSIVLSGSQRATEAILDELKPDYIYIAGPLGHDESSAEDQQFVAKTLRTYAGTSAIYKNSEVEIYKINRPHS